MKTTGLMSSALVLGVDPSIPGIEYGSMTSLPMQPRVAESVVLSRDHTIGAGRWDICSESTSGDRSVQSWVWAEVPIPVMYEPRDLAFGNPE